ncbi:hypothetical protein G9A89_000279, partial [Geosiphon pyriformis]
TTWAVVSFDLVHLRPSDQRLGIDKVYWGCWVFVWARLMYLSSTQLSNGIPYWLMGAHLQYLLMDPTDTSTIGAWGVNSFGTSKGKMDIIGGDWSVWVMVTIWDPQAEEVVSSVWVLIDDKIWYPRSSHIVLIGSSKPKVPVIGGRVEHPTQLMTGPWGYSYQSWGSSDLDLVLNETLNSRPIGASDCNYWDPSLCVSMLACTGLRHDTGGRHKALYTYGGIGTYYNYGIWWRASWRAGLRDILVLPTMAIWSLNNALTTWSIATTPTPPLLHPAKLMLLMPGDIYSPCLWTITRSLPPPNNTIPPPTVCVGFRVKDVIGMTLLNNSLLVLCCPLDLIALKGKWELLKSRYSNSRILRPFLDIQVPVG